MWQEGDEAPYESILELRGDDIQKLSVIQSLPSLLATDTQSCMSRVVPKMQQSLPTASTDIHIAASTTFKTILEQKLVSHTVFSQTFLQSILHSLDSSNSIICQAWLETLLDVIELLPVEVIRTQILPMIINKGQLSETIPSRVTCSRLLGKICTRFDSTLIQKEVLPTVHSLCQDVSSDVRADICLQLRSVAKGLGTELLKAALLPSLVELASDEESNVRYASVQTIVHLLPQLQEDTIKSIIVPLVKKLCESAIVVEDGVMCIIAQEFGQLVHGLEYCLSAAEKTWFLKYYQQLAQMGLQPVNTSMFKKDIKQDIHSTDLSSTAHERYAECRQSCAFNMPAMFIFVSSSGDDTDMLLPTFSALTSDSYYMVRRTVACGFHEVAKVLGPKSVLIKGDFIKLLKDDSDEVLQGLVPHIATTLDCLSQSQVIGVDRPVQDSTVGDIGKALLKCEAEIASTNNWRLTSVLYGQLEILPKCFPSDFIYDYFVPIAFTRIKKARPLPVRLAAGRLYLQFLRYNGRSMQRSELRNRLYKEIASNQDCYIRMLFVRMMVEALAIFSSDYFKAHFFTTLLSLAEDSVPNIRMKVVSLFPLLKSHLRVPVDKSLLGSLEASVRHLMSTEKDRDVLATLASIIKKLEDVDVKYDTQNATSKSVKQDPEDLRKQEEERRLSALGKSPTGAKKVNRGKLTMDMAKAMTHPLSRDTAASARQSIDPAKSSISSNNLTSNWTRFSPNRTLLTHPLERARHYNANVSSASVSFDGGSYNDYDLTRQQCSCPRLAVFGSLFSLPSSACEHEYQGNLSRCCSCPNAESEFLKSRNHAHERFSPVGLTKSSLLANLRDSRYEAASHALLTRDLPRDFRTNLGGKDKAPDFAALRALTNAAHYNSCWAFSSVPEVPVTLSDDEFLVDAGIRIPAQLSSGQAGSKIPNWQDIVLGKRRAGSVERSRRVAMNYEKVKPKRHSSVEYEDCMKPRPNGAEQTKSVRTSVDYEDGLRQRNAMKENLDEQRQMPKIDTRTKRYSAPHGRTRFGFEANQGRTMDDKSKRNSLILDKEKAKPANVKCPFDRSKRHSMNYSVKLPEAKDTNSKQKIKRHSLEMTDYTSTERLDRALRRYSTLDVNHNQGLSKIPLRSSMVSGSRTAPATRSSSPIRSTSQLRFDMRNREDALHGTIGERGLNRFSSSDEEVDKLCQMSFHSQTAPNSRAESPRARDSKLPIRLLTKKL